MTYIIKAIENGSFAKQANKKILIFEVPAFKEVKLETGLNHGFNYKPFAAWVDPVVEWFQIFALDYRARKATRIDGH